MNQSLENEMPTHVIPKTPASKYEYLSCYEGGSGQLDRVFNSPPDKRAESLKRITRNKSFYLAVFFKSNPLTVKTIYEIQIDVIQAEVIRQLDRSRNAISHVGFTEKWARDHGKVVYQYSESGSK